MVVSEEFLKKIGKNAPGPVRRLCRQGGAARDHGDRPDRGDPGRPEAGGADAGADIGLFELNEAFAAQSLACVRTLGIDPARVNVNGGAIALGHPLGCTGAKLTATLLHEMQRSDYPLRLRLHVHRRRHGGGGDFREDVGRLAGAKLYALS